MKIGIAVHLIAGFIWIIGIVISVVMLFLKLDNQDMFSWIEVATPVCIAAVIAFVVAAVNMARLFNKSDNEW